MKHLLVAKVGLIGLILLAGPQGRTEEAVEAGEWQSQDLEFETPIYPASVVGTDDGDLIEVHYDGEGVNLEGRVNGLSAFRVPFDYCNGDQLSSPSEPRVIRVFAGDGQDEIRVEMPFSQCPCEILGGSGNDRFEINGCAGGNVHGNAGDDQIMIKEHNMELRIYGDSGDDTVLIEDITSTWVDPPPISQRNTP